MSTSTTPAAGGGDASARVAELVAAMPQGGSIRAGADSLHLAALEVISPDRARSLRRTAVEERAELLAVDERAPRTVPPLGAVAATVLAACSPSAVAIWRGTAAVDDIGTAAALSALLAVLAVGCAAWTERDRDRRPPADYPHVGATVRWVEAAAIALAIVLIIARGSTERGIGGLDGGLIGAVCVLAVASVTATALGFGASARDRHRRARRAALRTTATFHRGAPADTGRGIVTEQAAAAELADLSEHDRARLLALETAALRALAARDGAPPAALEQAIADARLRVRPHPGPLAPATGECSPLRDPQQLSSVELHGSQRRASHERKGDHG